jgi:hypothetical protein
VYASVQLVPLFAPEADDRTYIVVAPAADAPSTIEIIDARRVFAKRTRPSRDSALLRNR